MPSLVSNRSREKCSFLPNPLPLMLLFYARRAQKSSGIFQLHGPLKSGFTNPTDRRSKPPVTWVCPILGSGELF
jgi:hypothetical protein